MGRLQTKVTVIGEKEAGTDTELFWRNRTVWTAVFKELQMTVQVPIKVVLVGIAYMALSLVMFNKWFITFSVLCYIRL